MDHGVRATLIGHVESAVWWATVGGGQAVPPFAPVVAAVWEAAVGFAEPAMAYQGTGLPTWTELAAGDVDWADLLARSSDHPAERHLGTAALLYAARIGLLGRLLDGPVDPDGTEALLGFGERDGWCVDRSASDELRGLAGVGLLPDPAGWLRARLVFESDWFWAPLSALCGAIAPAADFGAPGRAEAFRAASARLNRLAAPLRARSARVVAGVLGDEPRRVLELGAVSPVWGAALTGARRTIVDYPAVLGPDRPGVEAISQDPLDTPPDRPFDVVVIDELLHTAPPDVAAELLAAAASRVAPGGVLIVVEPLLDDDRRAPRPILATQVKVALTGGGRMWTATDLILAMRAHNLRPARPRAMGGAHVSIARR